MKIYSLLVVKDEADIITLSVTDALRWSDKVIVIDNGSTDGTWEKLQTLATADKRIVLFMRYEGPFHIGLRAKAFRAFRKEMNLGDWWCVRLDADEMYPGDVRTFLKTIPWYCRTVKKSSTDYVITHEDIQEGILTGDFAADRQNIHYHLPEHREERRFMRHSPLLIWLSRWRYPHPWGIVSKRRIPVDHYQYRSEEQMQRRYANRQKAKADGCGSFSHEKGGSWREYLRHRDDCECSIKEN
ncbi:MAG: glycosyltransferase family 2 protein [Bacteroidales bacterium]|nr:glycosyltransferase family 2 protein [Bacteroidales bacterium]